MRRSGVLGGRGRVVAALLACAIVAEAAGAPPAGAGGPMPSRRANAIAYGITEPYVKVTVVGPGGYHGVFVRTLANPSMPDPVRAALPADLAVGDYDATVTVHAGRRSSTRRVVLGMQRDGDTAAGAAATRVRWLFYLSPRSRGMHLASLVEPQAGPSAGLPPVMLALALVAALVLARRFRPRV